MNDEPIIVFHLCHRCGKSAYGAKVYTVDRRGAAHVGCLPPLEPPQLDKPPTAGEAA